MRNKRFLLLLLTAVLSAAAAGASFDYTMPPQSVREKKEKKMEPKHKYTNHLINQSSPYLLMHAHNPVDWYPWGRQALEKAKKENKLIILSIGYAACHWCHVMEEETFSDPGAAEIMNKYFVSIKVDREERPDIDQVYMDAAHLLTGSGGWPLNAVALPDGKPIFAATYFPKEKWISLLERINQLYRENPGQLEQQAEALTQGICDAGAITFNTEKPEFDPQTPTRIFEELKRRSDYEWGGEHTAPKFPMPTNYRFLLVYYYFNRQSKALEAVTVTLEKMAMGGIYDQVGGGFARYSTDANWKVPHFEKMLYDNAQLVSLYSYAYQLTQNPLYKNVVYETLEFVERELTPGPAANGGHGFYSSLDADSEGEEGKFYLWTEAQINDLLGKDAPLITDYYNISRRGNWENGRNILYRQQSDREFAAAKKIDIKELQVRLTRAKKRLLKARSRRIRPALDDKILTAWNGLMLTGYVDAYRVFDEPRFLEQALQNARFIVANMMDSGGRLDRNYKDGKSTINGFLDDYAFTIQAFISLYQATFEEKWLHTAETLLKYTLVHFFDKKSGMFYYTSGQDPALIARKMEISDNVIPGSNSQMAANLYLLGEYFYNNEYIETSRRMLNNIKMDLVRGGAYYANWSRLLLMFVHPIAEVAILGDGWKTLRKELDRHFLPHMILMGGKTEGNLPLLKNKLAPGQTTIYVCRSKSCLLPVTKTEEALEQLK